MSGLRANTALAYARLFKNRIAEKLGNCREGRLIWPGLDCNLNNIRVRSFIPTGAPTKSNSYEEFGLRLWPNSYQLATMRQLYERDRDVSRIGVLIPPFGGSIPPAPANISMT